jgi:lambda family phage minor tail protein L
MPDFKNSSNDSGGIISTVGGAQNSIKKLHGEAAKLEPTALIELFEVDLSDILTPDRLEKREKFNQLNVLAGGSLVTDPASSAISVFRFHNNIKLIKRDIWFQGNRYFPFPCKAEGFEVNANGTAATPKITFGSRPDGSTRFAILKELLKDLDDLAGARVNRIRTFAKFLDSKNWYDDNGDRLYEDIPKDIAPDEGAFFPPDVYYVDKKSYEDKTGLQFQLASYVNFEGMKLPRRIFNQNRCPWTYRGAGCCYEYESTATTLNLNKTPIDAFYKAELPQKAPPVATENNELIQNIIPGYSPNTCNTPVMWNQGTEYVNKAVVYIAHKDKRYYFVAKKSVPANTPPPNDEYWVADQCSKTLEGCKNRWASEVSLPDSPYNGAIPFGGFPAITRQ